MDDARWRWPFYFTIDGEAGLDAGGLSREVVRLAASELTSLEFGLFRLASTDALSYALQSDRAVAAALGGDGAGWLEFAGKLVAKALLDGTHLDFHLDRCLLKHVCGEPVALADLRFLDYALFASLTKVLDMDVTDLALTFSVDIESFGAVETVDLVENGADVPVTEANKRAFVDARVKAALFTAYADNIGAFLRGVYAVVPAEAFLLASSRDLELLLCGAPDLDVAAWRANTAYKGAFAVAGDAHRVVGWFWEVLAEYAPARRAQLLQWCTGHGRVPVQGFSHLQGRDGVLRPFTLTSVSLDAAIFPRAHTCFNRIDVPLYESKADLAKALTLVLDLGDCTFSMD